MYVHMLIQMHITLICLNIEPPKIINFPFASSGKLIILGIQKIRTSGLVSVSTKRNAIDTLQ